MERVCEGRRGEGEGKVVLRERGDVVRASPPRRAARRSSQFLTPLVPPLPASRAVPRRPGARLDRSVACHARHLFLPKKKGRARTRFRAPAGWQAFFFLSFAQPRLRSHLTERKKKKEHGMKVADWDTFAARAARLVESAPLASRCVIKYDHAKGGLTVRVTDDTTVRERETRGSDRRRKKKTNPHAPRAPPALSLSRSSLHLPPGPPVRDRPAGGREAGGAPGGPVHGRGGYGHHAGGR